MKENMGHTPVYDIPFLDDVSEIEELWLAYRAAIVVRLRVDTPEIRAEVQRAKYALLEALDT